MTHFKDRAAMIRTLQMTINESQLLSDEIEHHMSIDREYPDYDEICALMDTYQWSEDNMSMALRTQCRLALINLKYYKEMTRADLDAILYVSKGTKWEFMMNGVPYESADHSWEDMMNVEYVI